MSYLIYNDVGTIVSVSYNEPSMQSKYIEVSSKVCDDFLDGKISTTNYKIVRRKFRNDKELVPKEFDETRLRFADILFLVKFYITNFFLNIKFSFHRLKHFIITWVNTIKYIKLLIIQKINLLFLKCIAVIKYFILRMDYEIRYFSLSVINVNFRLFNLRYKICVPKLQEPRRIFISLLKRFLNTVTNLVKKIFVACCRIFSPYGAFPGEVYLYSLLGYGTIQGERIMSVPANKIENLCIAPWTHLHTWPNNKVLPCCLTPMHDTVGDLNKSSLREIWNGNKMTELRLRMLNNERPKSCSRCYAIEDAGGASYRHHLNKIFSKDFDLVPQTKWNGHVDKINIKYWDFRFSNICNFKCRSCGPQLSSGWYEDTEKLWGKLPFDVPQGDLTKPSWDELLPLFEIVEEIYFAGGEPLLMEEHYKILNKLVEMKRFDVRITYNTNFSVMKYKKLNVLDIWPYFDTVRVGASIDAYGERAEYIRSGTKWNQIVTNRENMKKYCPNADFYVNFTLGALNAVHMVDFHQWAIESKFIKHPTDFHINLIQHPTHLSMQALPIEIKQELSLQWHRLALHFRKARLQPLDEQFLMAANYMNENDTFDAEKENFAKSIFAVDDLRNENFRQTFPELERMVA
jgi:MoaA/NifB/PqqE/SkfB family radical SAM enzyme